MLLVKILGAVLAVALGVWLGLPGRYDPDMDELERNMLLGTGRTRKVKRHFTPLAWLQRKLSPRSGEAARRRRFKLERPEDR